MIAFRHADPRMPFLREEAGDSGARWHDAGDEGPVNYLSDTPDGAWAEFLRHEEIRDAQELATIRRALWAVDIGDEATAVPALPEATLTGGRESYAACRQEARRLRATGATRFDAPSAALLPGGACGHRVDAGLRAGPARQGRTIVLFGCRPLLIGWRAAYEGRPADELLTRVRHLRDHPTA